MASMKDLVGCPHCAKEAGYKGRAPVTFFVRYHPFAEGWEVRECEECHRLSAWPCDGEVPS